MLRSICLIAILVYVFDALSEILIKIIVLVIRTLVQEIAWTIFLVQLNGRVGQHQLILWHAS